LGLRHAGDAGKDIGAPGVRIDVVEFRACDQRGYGGGTLSTAIGTGEELGFPAEGEASERAFGGIVGQADATIIEDGGEAIEALEHIVDWLCDG